MNTSRYEIKFVLNPLQVSHALKWIYFQTSAKKAYQPRIVNSIYFDDAQFTAANDNITGVSRRSKYRLRWYGDSSNIDLDNINFEIKKRVNRIGSKIRQKIDFDSQFKNLTFLSLEQHLRRHLQPAFLIDHELFPTLQVSYKREYFEGGQGIRVTLDKDIKYNNTALNSSLFSSKAINYPMTIMEVKVNPSLIRAVSNSFKGFHLAPKRHSKYLTGISILRNASYI
jgi:hypothetical protein